MYSKEEFVETAKELSRINDLTFEEAMRLLAFVGDTPEIDEDGMTIVRDDAGEIIGRVRFPAFTE